jgi:hypothetical protein
VLEEGDGVGEGRRWGRVWYACVCVSVLGIAGFGLWALGSRGVGFFWGSGSLW